MTWEKPDFDKKLAFPEPPENMSWELLSDGYGYISISLTYYREYKLLGVFPYKEKMTFDRIAIAESEFTTEWAIHQATLMTNYFHKHHKDTGEGKREFDQATQILNGNDLR